MDATSQLILTTIGLVLSVVVAVALPVLTVRRYRDPQRQRDAWLGVNAQRGMTIALHVFVAFKLTVCAVMGALLALVFDWPLAWALVPVAIGGLVSIVITGVMTSRMPSVIEHHPSSTPRSPTREHS